MNIIQRFIPTKFKDTRPGYTLVPKYITIHETDNTAPKANAEAHARLQEGGNSRQASWHMQVDETYAIQSIPFNEVAWAAGDGANGPGNRTSIHIEICVNSDGDYKKAVANAAEVTKQLMQQFSIPISNVVQHNHWSGKNCPSIMRSGKAGVTWDDFLALCTKKEVNQVYFFTGGYTGEALAKVHGFIKENKWWFEPSKGADGTIFFKVGAFDPRYSGMAKMENFLKENNYWYEKREN